MKPYCMYLRKSRADAEAEARGEGETLARHRRTLTELAKKRGLEVVQEYCEIVSGDSIAARPQMQAMLQAVTDGTYTGVLCMEIERLARGNTIDQGIVAQAFKESGTLIVTPVKTYDPDNEFDEEYFEFSLFMSRREYKTIKRRLQAGRLATIKEGNYISPTAPYGYRKIHPEPKVHTLEICEPEAEVIRQIYAWYLGGRGARFIAAELNRMGVPPMKTALWEPPSVKKILSNPIYAGFVQWHSKESGDTRYPGLHPAIIPPEQFEAVQTKRKNNPAAQIKPDGELRNYYHNILYCAECGHQMQRRYTRETGHAHILCRKSGCPTVSSTLTKVDEVLLTSLRFRLQELQQTAFEEQESPPPTSKKQDPRKLLEQELVRIRKQQNKLYDFLEQEIYDTNTFLERMKMLNGQKEAVEAELEQFRKADAAPALSREEQIVRIQYILEHFAGANAEEKNRMLRNTMKRILYQKSQRGCYRKPDTDLSLHIEFL